jgi:hypothetical protein
MKLNKLKIQFFAISLTVISITACTGRQSEVPIPDSEAAFSYLKGLEGKWVVQGDEEGVFGWEFDVTSRGRVIVERLKVGTPTEMTTVYHLDNGLLIGNHYCQLQNQPKLTAITSDTEGDLHFLCDGKVGNTQSHDELHMHGVHFQKKDTSLLIWMDMFKNGKLDFETRYELFRVDSVRTVIQEKQLL